MTDSVDCVAVCCSLPCSEPERHQNFHHKEEEPITAHSSTLMVFKFFCRKIGGLGVVSMAAVLGKLQSTALTAQQLYQHLDSSQQALTTWSNACLGTTEPFYTGGQGFFFLRSTLQATSVPFLKWWG